MYGALQVHLHLYLHPYLYLNLYLDLICMLSQGWKISNTPCTNISKRQLAKTGQHVNGEAWLARSRLKSIAVSTV